MISIQQFNITGALEEVKDYLKKNCWVYMEKGASCYYFESRGHVVIYHKEKEMIIVNVDDDVIRSIRGFKSLEEIVK